MVWFWCFICKLLLHTDLMRTRGAIANVVAAAVAARIANTLYNACGARFKCGPIVGPCVAHIVGVSCAHVWSKLGPYMCTSCANVMPNTCAHDVVQAWTIHVHMMWTQPHVPNLGPWPIMGPHLGPPWGHDGPKLWPPPAAHIVRIGPAAWRFTVAWHERLAACLYMCAHAFTITMHERLAAWYFIDTSGLPLDMFARAACRNRCCT